MATRRESVRLELIDNFTSEMARAAAATALLNKQLDGLSKESVETRQATRSIGRDVEALGRTSGRAEKDIDKLSGRLRILADVAAALGPAAIPITAVAIPAITGLAASLGFAAVGAGVLITAFQGVGDALKDLNKAALDPTAENLAAAELSLGALSPAAAEFTKQLSELAPALNVVQEMAAEGALPGFSTGLDAALTRLPELAQVVTGFSTSLGNIADNLGGAIEDGRVDQFLNFLADEGPEALEEFATIIGQTSLGLANMWMAFTPLNTDFSDFLVQTTADFEMWSKQLSGSASFQEFVDYIRETGPQVADALGAIGSALVQIVQAASPLAGPILQVVESLFNSLASFADSDLGTPIFGLVAALGALNLAVRSYQAISRAAFTGPAVTQFRTYAGGLNLVTSAQQRAALSAQQLAAAEAKRSRSLRGGAAGIAAVGLVATGAADGIGLTNTATLGLLGSIAGGPGVVAGGLIGAIYDARAATEGFAEALAGADLDIASGDVDRLTSRLQSLRSVLADQKAGSGNPVIDFLNGDAVGAIPVAGAFIDQFTPDVNPEDTKDKIAEVELALKLAEATSESERATLRKAEADKKAATEIQRLRDEAAGAVRSFVGFDDTLDESTISLDTWIKHLNKQATALKDFATNAETATRRGLADGLVKQLADAGPAGALRLKQLADAADSEIARANRAYGRGQEGIKQYQDVADGLEPIVLDVAAERANEELTRIERILDRLGIGVTIPVKFVRGQGPTIPKDKQGSGLPFVQTPADGGTIAPIRRAYGGTVPGVRWPYFDKVPMIAAPGEEVIGNRFGQADKNRGALKAANAGATIGVVGFAAGGEVQPFRSYAAVAGGASMGGASIDYSRLASAVAEVRPLYGDVSIQPHNYSEFKRQMQQDQRSASVGGVKL